MKRLLILALVLATGAAWAARSSFNLFAWDPIVFEVGGGAARAGMDELKSANDAVFLKMQKMYPGFAGTAAEVFAFAATVNLETRALPPVSFDTYTGRDADEKLEYLSRTIAREVNDIRQTISSQMSEIFGRENYDEYGYKYLYCEQNPSSKADFCQDESSAEWIFVRRLFSRPEFVKGICPVAAEYALWNLNWNADQTEDIDAYFKELDRVLAIYGGNAWSEKLVGTIDSKMDYTFMHMLDRRYLDGGPKLMLAVKDCAAQIHSAFKAMRPAGDARATAAIADILKFKSVPISGNYSIGLSSATLSLGDLFRLTRHYGADNILRPPQQEMEWEPEMSVDDVIRMTINLNQLDPVYNYRLLNLPEFRLLVKRGETVITGREQVVAVSQDYNRYGLEGLERYLIRLDDYESPRDVGGSENQYVSSYIIVREKK